jgi:hypothetical protein
MRRPNHKASNAKADEEAPKEANRPIPASPTLTQNVTPVGNETETLEKDATPPVKPLRQGLQDEIANLTQAEKTGTSHWITYEGKPQVQWKIKMKERKDAVYIELAGLQSANDWPEEGLVFFYFIFELLVGFELQSAYQTKL